MALPVSLDADLSVGDQNSYHGPFKSSGGNYYTVLRGTSTTAGQTNAVSLQKATDPTSSFAEQDAEQIAAAGGESLASIWCYQKGGAGNDTIDIAVQKSSGTSNPFNVYHTTASLSADTIAVETTVDSAPAGDEGPNAAACSVSRETTGTDIVVAYQGEADKVMGTAYARIDVKRWTGAAWGSVIAIDNGGEVHWTGPVIVQGSSDRMHIFFAVTIVGDAYQRTLRSDDSLETFASAYDSDVASPYAHKNGVSYDDGGTQRVRCPYANGATGTWLGMAKLDSADSPTVTTDANFNDNPPSLISGTADNAGVISAANDTTTLYVLFVDTANDLWRDENADDAGWGTDVEVLDAVTVHQVFANVYDRSGKKLAYIYLDGSQVKYNEVDIAGALILGIATETSSALAVGALKEQAIGLASSAESALAVTAAQGRTIVAGLAASAESAFAVGKAKAKLVGFATSTESALPAVPLRAYTLGLALAAESALAAVWSKALAVGIAQSTESALPVTADREYLLGLALETDSALSATALQPQIVIVGLASAAESAFPVTAMLSKVIVVGLASSAESALAVGKAKAKTIGFALSTESALPLSALRSYTLGLATSTELAFAVSVGKAYSVGLATEADTALAVAIDRGYLLGLAVSTESAFAATPVQVGAVLVGLALSAESALPVGKAKAKEVGLATENDIALSAGAGAAAGEASRVHWAVDQKGRGLPTHAPHVLEPWREKKLP